ncbi:hypothetical protein [Enterococcus avium]|nr:hypothetical protein [Enterococcus avium]MCU1810081.1 hypothetical protein [Enterococcus faecium]
MQENNVSRIIYLIGGLIILSLAIDGLVEHWPEIKLLIRNFYDNKMIKM